MDYSAAADIGVLPGTTIQVDPSSAFASAGDFGISLGTGTGQHGTTPLLGSGGTMTDAINDVWSWINQPFTTPMSPWTLALMVGVVLIAVIFWNIILYHLRIAAETI